VSDSWHKRLRYFCEYCGAEVGKDARICPRCGRFFSSVKCPRCGHTGKVEDFSFGCPACGCALRPNDAPEPIKRAPVPASPVPTWAYLLALLVLVALVALLVRVLS